MKKIVIVLVATCLSLTLLPLRSNAATTEPTSSLPASEPVKPAESERAKTLELRLTEINTMDKSNLKSAEKKNLRKEVKSIRHELRTISGGVYLSAGLVILILIILVILV